MLTGVLCNAAEWAAHGRQMCLQLEQEGCDDDLVKTHHVTLTMYRSDLHIFRQQHFSRAERQVLAHSLSFNTWSNQPNQSENFSGSYAFFLGRCASYLFVYLFIY